MTNHKVTAEDMTQEVRDAIVNDLQGALALVGQAQGRAIEANLAMERDKKAS